MGEGVAVLTDTIWRVTKTFWHVLMSHPCGWKLEVVANDLKMSQQWESTITDRLVKFFSAEKETVGKREDLGASKIAFDPFLQALHNISNKLPLDTRLKNIPEFCQFVQNRE